MSFKPYILFILLGCSLISYAQSLEIKSFTPIPMDLSASTESRQDYNGNYCALVKVVAPNVDFTAQGNIIGDIERKGEETWCYLTTGSKNLKIVPAGYEPILISFEDLGIPSLVSKKTYSLVLSVPASSTRVQLSQSYPEIKLRNYKASDYAPTSDLWMAIACELNEKQVFYSHSTWMGMKESDKDKHKILGVLLPTANNFFIVACRDEGSHMYRWEEAMTSFGEKLPSEDECDIIAHSTIPLCDTCVTLDQAMNDYGGELVTGLYWGWEDGNKSRYELEDSKAVVMMVERDGQGKVKEADNGWSDKIQAAKVRLVKKIHN